MKIYKNEEKYWKNPSVDDTRAGFGALAMIRYMLVAFSVETCHAPGHIGPGRIPS